MTTNKNFGRSHAPQETATYCSYVVLQANVSTVWRFANMHIALNHEWNITGNYAVSMHKTLEHWCVPYIVISHLQREVWTDRLFVESVEAAEVVFFPLVETSESYCFSEKNWLEYWLWVVWFSWPAVEFTWKPHIL